VPAAGEPSVFIFACQHRVSLLVFLLVLAAIGEKNIVNSIGYDIRRLPARGTKRKT
jgi:hypothetical protein